MNNRFKSRKSWLYFVSYFNHEFLAHAFIGFDVFNIVFVEVSNTADSLLPCLSIFFQIFNDSNFFFTNRTNTKVMVNA